MEKVKRRRIKEENQKRTQVEIEEKENDIGS